MGKILIVGGVAGGATAAARLRRLDEHAEIILFEKDEYISFANCGLPYHIGGVIEDREELLLQTPKSFNRRFNIDVRIFSEVTSINRDAKTISVSNSITKEQYEETYDTLILAPGSMPIVPSIAGLDSKGVFTLRNVANTDKIVSFMHEHNPKNAVIIGGGYIGVEMAENLKKAGLDVSIVEMAQHVIASLDFDMACDVHHYLQKKGIQLFLCNGVQAVNKVNEKLCVSLQNGELETDMLILATGVKADSHLAKEAGLEVNARGGIVVDNAMRTSDENIYAVGDTVEVVDFVTGESVMIPLAGPANKQGRIAADNICGIKSKYGGTQGSSILKIFDMTIATTGINEQIAERKNLNFEKVFAWLPGHASYYPGTKPMSIKVLFDKSDGKILGAQIVGFDGVDKRCDLFAMAIRFGMTAYDLTQIELCYAPPFSSAKDPINMIGYMIENVIEGRVKLFHWHDVDILPRDGSVTLLDVRTEGEVKGGKIEGFLHIPVDDLRERIGELRSDRPIYVHCHSGLRSYIACRILEQNGFDAYNLSGGYRLYKSVETK